jgi:hypothetical protein
MIISTQPDTYLQEKNICHEKILMAAVVDPSEQSTQQKMGVINGTWNIKYVYVSVYLRTVFKESAKCKLHLMGVLEVRRQKCDTASAADCIPSVKTAEGLLPTHCNVTSC